MSGLFGGGTRGQTQAEKDAEVVRVRADERASAQKKQKCRAHKVVAG